jgi:predicted nucleotidyltransferase
MYTLLSEQNLTKLKTYFQNQPEVDLVYLFGSQVTGKIHPESDLDVGVLLDEQIESRAYLDLQIQMTADLMELLRFNEIDLVILNRAPATLRHPIIRDRQLIYCRKEEIRVTFVFETIRDYLDDLYTQKIYSEGLTRRIQEGEYGHLKRSHRISLEGIRKLSQKIREDR